MAHKKRNFASSLWRRGGDKRNQESGTNSSNNGTNSNFLTMDPRDAPEMPCLADTSVHTAALTSSASSPSTSSAATTSSTTTATTTTTTPTTLHSRPSTTPAAPASSERMDLRGSDLTNPLTLNLLYTVIDAMPITTIDLSWTHLGDDTAETLLSDEHHVLHSQTIKELILCGNGLGRKGKGDYLARFLRENKSVTKLHLGSNSLSSEFVNSLANGLRHNEYLEELDLWNCSIGDKAGAQILTSAQSAKSLRTLRLNLNKLGPLSLKAATQLLQAPTALQVLNLDTNPNLFGREDEDEVAFVDALTANTTLRWLGVPYTGIKDFVAGLIFTALTQNASLEYIDVGYNEINKEGYAVMVDCIPKMKALKFLRTHARAQLVSAEVLTQAIEQNTTLHQFTSICVGCSRLWASLRRNQVMSRADEFVCNDQVPLNALPNAIEKLSVEKDGGTSATFQLLQCYLR